VNIEDIFQYTVRNPTTGCLLWTGLTVKGYGQAWIDGKHMYVHVAAYLITHGSVPKGKKVCHRCGIKRCIEPEHVVAWTQAQNMAHYVAERTHCAKGHEYTTDNTYLAQRGKYTVRVCRKCNRVWTNKSKRRLSNAIHRASHRRR
jgi:HNH endonuclease